MCSDDLSDSGSEYVQGASNEEVSGDSDVSYDSDEELLCDNEYCWAGLAPHGGSVQSDRDGTGISGHVPQFTCPRDAFCFIFL